MTQELVSLLPIEEDEGEIEWRCEMRYDDPEVRCENEPTWVAAFACTCIGAACDDHKRLYTERLRTMSFLGMVTVNCAVHGRVQSTTEQAVTWSLL
jgi:hypothetical protein